MILSIIIPLYNQEIKIKTLLDMLTPQLNKNTELIIVNDGSTDSSLSVCKEYDKFDTLKIIDKSNGGVSSARNAGLNVALGDFITFIDSDDMVSENYVETVLSLCNINADLIQMNYFKMTNNIYKKIDLVQYSGKAEYKDYFELLFHNKVNMLWNKIFKRSIIVDNKICFSEELIIAEDIIFIIKYLMNTKDIYNCLFSKD